jgi:AcrR family transcriptional regulator
MNLVKSPCEDHFMTTPLTEGRARPGGRAARVVEAVHRAAFALLDEVGYEQLQLPDVAERAGVNKTTVYRRWPTKVALVADLLGVLMQSSVATPDTGSVQSDLELLLAEVAKVLSSRAVRSVLRATMALSDDDPAVRAAQQTFFAERFARSGAIVERAVARGELAAGTDPRRLLELAASPVYFRVLFAAEEVGEDEVRQVVSTVLRAHSA